MGEVEENNVGRKREHRREGDPLFLPARKSIDRPPLVTLKANSFERHRDLRRHLLGRRAEILQGESDLIFHVEGTKLAFGILEDHRKCPRVLHSVE